SAESTPAPTTAASSPTECPAIPSGRRSARAARAFAAISEAATMSGWAMRVSRMVSASDSVPCLIRSTSAASEYDVRLSATPSSSSQGARKPGVCEPCPGQATTITHPVCQRSRRNGGCTLTRFVCSFVRGAQNLTRPPSGGAAANGLCCAYRPQDQGGLQDQRFTRAGGVPADDFADALEAVAHGVRMHEQLACGRFERPAVVEVAPQRGDQIGRMRLQRAVDAVDESL